MCKLLLYIHPRLYTFRCTLSELTEGKGAYVVIKASDVMVATD